MSRKTEFQYKRLFEVIENCPDPYSKVWELKELLEAVNRLIPKHLIIKSGMSLAGLITNQYRLKVFRYRYGISRNNKQYYIFIKHLPVGE